MASVKVAVFTEQSPADEDGGGGDEEEDDGGRGAFGSGGGYGRRWRGGAEDEGAARFAGEEYLGATLGGTFEGVE